MSDAPRDELEVSPLELFLDLVFAFTTTQLTTLLTAGLFAALPQVVLILVVLFWMYEGYVWLTNQVPITGVSYRLGLILGTSGFLMCALATPAAFGGDGGVFGLGYLLLVLVHLWIFAKSIGSEAFLFAPFNVLGSFLLIAAGLMTAAATYALWLGAIALQFVSAGRAQAITRRIGWHIHASHFVERSQALLLIAIGESIIATGIGLEGERLDASLVGGAMLGFALAAGLWWTHFDVDEGLGVQAMQRGSPAFQMRLALGGYFYSYLLLLLGIVAAASGVRLSIAHITGPDVPEGAMFLAGGVAVYLVGDVVYRLFCRVRPIWTRIGAAGVALLTIPIGTAVTTGAQLVALIAVIGAVLVIEATRVRTRLLAAA